MAIEIICPAPASFACGRHACDGCLYPARSAVCRVIRTPIVAGHPHEVRRGRRRDAPAQLAVGEQWWVGRERLPSLPTVGGIAGLLDTPVHQGDDETGIRRGVIDRPTCQDRLRVVRSEEHTSELQSLRHLVCRLLLEKKKE